jgi:hypothetical protein
MWTMRLPSTVARMTRSWSLRVFASTAVSNMGDTSVALAKVGKGKLGYVGDVNAEDGSDSAVLALCGLLA